MPNGGIGGALRALSGRPELTWPDAAIHHGFRIVLLLALALLVQVVFPVTPAPDTPPYEKGDVPQQDLIADARFTIPKSDSELAQEREEAAAAVAPIFRYDSAAMDSMLAKVRRFQVHLDSAALSADSEPERSAQLRALLEVYGFPVNPEALDLLADAETRAVLFNSLERVIQQEMPLGIVSSADYEDSPAPQWRLLRDGSERVMLRDTVRTPSHLLVRAADHLPPRSAPGLADFQRLVLILFVEGSYKLDRERTDAAREAARQAVPVIKGEVLRGERIIAAHEPIRDREIERLAAYNAFLQANDLATSSTARLPEQFGAFLLNLLVLSIFGFLLFYYRPTVYENARHVLLLALLVAVLTGSAAAVSRTGGPVELVPIAFPALVIAALWDGRLALNFAFVMTMLLSLQNPFLSMSSRVIMLMGGSAAALSVRVVRRRSQGLVLGSVISLVYAFAIIALGLLRSREGGEVMSGVLWGAANGLASALIAMGFLPLFESFTKITTEQTLLELADLNRPLLKRLSLEASGTYAHSINVANLAEAAARAIDANPLLARVGAYYHDVGKMAMPQYFIENQARGRNPHDQIEPQKSAAIVRAHVAEGVKFAEQAKLPEVIRRFIPEHHGTQSIGFFYDQARKANPDADLDPADFAYSGPNPQSKETAILMIADSLESAAKVLQEPTPDRIRALVDRIVDNKIAQGQLDDAPLTMGDVSRVKEAFASVLTGMYHHRIDYPALRVPVEGEPAPPADGAAT